MGLKPAFQLLLVTDDPAILEALPAYLQQQGFGITHAVDGKTGLLKVAEGTFDLIIIDDMLSGSKGIELLRRIRKQEDLPVVMLTGKTDEIDTIVAIELGADDYLPKSVNPRELAARLRSILRRSR
jgi:two-component system phosphate regulon response regulator OmpR